MLIVIFQSPGAGFGRARPGLTLLEQCGQLQASPQWDPLLGKWSPSGECNYANPSLTTIPLLALSPGGLPPVGTLSHFIRGGLTCLLGVPPHILRPDGQKEPAAGPAPTGLPSPLRSSADNLVLCTSWHVSSLCIRHWKQTFSFRRRCLLPDLRQVCTQGILMPAVGEVGWWSALATGAGSSTDPGSIGLHTHTLHSHSSSFNPESSYVLLELKLPSPQTEKTELRHLFIDTTIDIPGNREPGQDLLKVPPFSICMSHSLCRGHFPPLFGDFPRTLK